MLQYLLQRDKDKLLVVRTVVFGDLKHPFWVSVRVELSCACRFTQRCLMPQKHKSRRGHSGASFPGTVIKKALKLRARPVKDSGKTHMSYRKVSAAVGAFSSATVLRWSKKDMSPEAAAIRRKNSGHNRTLSLAEDRVAAGWFISRCIRRLPTTSAHARLFFASAFNLHIKPAWLTRFAARNHLSVRRSRGCKFVEMSVARLQEAVQFLIKLHSLGKEPSQILALDKTTVYNDITRMGQWGPKGRYRIFSGQLKLKSNFLLVVPLRGGLQTVGRRTSCILVSLPTGDKRLSSSLRTTQASQLLCCRYQKVE